MRLFSGKTWIDRQPKRVSSAALRLETKAGVVLIVKATYKDYWTLPGGFIDLHETPKAAAIRETLEETGIKIDPKTVEFVAVIDRFSSMAQTYQFVFAAPLDDAVVSLIVLQKSEIEAYDFVTKDQVLSGDRHYGQVLYHWANDVAGYIEQPFAKGKE